VLVPSDTWQERLERHFESLARQRADSGFPIFAFEHGLNDQELEEISAQLRSRIKSNLSPSPHWLLWVVYATERGYTYAGDEYWLSFEEHTPNWYFADRYELASWFVKFQKAYNGVVPSGPWAKYFKIIAWPITHAILPKYLQRQFARALYDLRFSLAELESLKPASIGRVLAANSHYASTRFQQFLQQEELTGRIVLALLGQTPAGTNDLIYPPTLERIVRDLAEVRNAREWLQEAQRAFKDRFIGVGRGGGPPGQHPPAIRDGRVTGNLSDLGIRPELLLRYSGASTWSVVMQVPSFRSVAALNPEIQALLKRTRCRLSGGQDMKPAGWLLSGNGKAILKSWPDAHKPLIDLEQSNGTLDHLLGSECRLNSGPPWLFRIGRDGTAKEIRGRIVRPGSEYILLTTAALPPPQPCMSLCSVDCSGVRSFRIRVPPVVTAQDTSWLRGLDVEVARTIRVWPAGLSGRGWDGEGNAEWLTTETPCFGVVHDYPVDAYTFNLDGGRDIVIAAGGVGHPMFLRLKPLAAGTHSLTIRAKRSPALDKVAPSPPAEGFVQLKVREPEPWIPGALLHPGLIVTLDPYTANLDMFWRNEVKLSVIGPENYSASFTVSLQAGDGQDILSEQIGGPMNLPVTPDAWSKRFNQFVRRADCAWRYLEAASGRLTVNAETLGEYTLHFEHEVLPLRCVLRREGSNIILRLIDDTGQEGSRPSLVFYGLEHPLRAYSYSYEEALSGFSVPEPGGLFFAQHAAHTDSVVVSVGLTAEGFQGLSVRPVLDELWKGSVTLAESLRLLEWWHRARPSGFLAHVRRRHVKDKLARAIFGMLCGPGWLNAEDAYKNRPTSQRTIDGLQRAVGRSSGFAAELRRDYRNLKGNVSDPSHWYAELAKRYQVCSDRTLCSFALAIARKPHRLPIPFKDRLEGLIAQILKKPAILRGARLLVLLDTAYEHRA
jgi:hypothetical protein